MMFKLLSLPVVFVLAATTGGNGDGCDSPSSDTIQRQQQETILQEGTAKVGMPAIKNFRERKLLKEILELRDQAGFTTYTYIWSDMLGRGVFYCNSIGYGLPYATQFTNPLKVVSPYNQTAVAINQADPNSLFSPASAEGTWVMCKDPNSDDVKPVYVEPRIITTPFRRADWETPVSSTTTKK